MKRVVPLIELILHVQSTFFHNLLTCNEWQVNIEEEGVEVAVVRATKTENGSVQT